MHKNKSYIELMALARIQMNGKASLLIGAMLMQAFIILFANSIGILLFPETDLISNILCFIITFIIQLFAGILQVGSCFLFLHAACNMPCQISDLFYAFKHSPDKAIKIQFAFALLDAICMIPANIVIFTTSNSLNYDTLLKTSIATLLGTYEDCPENWETRTVINMTHLLTPESLNIIFDCGVDDFFYEVNCNLHEKLMKEGIPHDFYVRPGRHNWTYWNNSIKYQMLFFSNCFSKAL